MEKLIEKFNKEISPKLMKDLSLGNRFVVPKIEKVVVSTGTGDFKEDDAAVKKISEELAKIVGQKARVNLSRKAVSSFKLRIGQPIGLSVTLRGEKMYDFIDRLINVALPRVRDFRGLSLKGFDGHGNYSIGIKEYMIFPEVKYEDATRPFGFQVNIKTNVSDDQKTKVLLENLGFPFEKRKSAASDKVGVGVPAPQKGPLGGASVINGMREKEKNG
jgi:large subunit ribosomal protein L5